MDSYLADLRRLQQLMNGFTEKKSGPAEDDVQLALQFVSGLPSAVATQVKALCGRGMDIRKLLECAKSILSHSTQQFDSVDVVAAGISSGKRTKFTGKCYGCGRVVQATVSVIVERCVLRVPKLVIFLNCSVRKQGNEKGNSIDINGQVKFGCSRKSYCNKSISRSVEYCNIGSVDHIELEDDDFVARFDGNRWV